MNSKSAYFPHLQYTFSHAQTAIGSTAHLQWAAHLQRVKSLLQMREIKRDLIYIATEHKAKSFIMANVVKPSFTLGDIFFKLSGDY